MRKAKCLHSSHCSLHSNNIVSFLFYSETESTATPAAVLPPAKLLPDEEDTEVHQEDSARDCQVSDSFAASLRVTLCNSQAVYFQVILFIQPLWPLWSQAIIKNG